MNTDNSKTYKIQSLLSVFVIVAGLLLMTYMVVVEDEPGAIPLLLIALGTLSYLYNRTRGKTRQA
jgi:hypothetical protein